jgi:hypothetical protein
MHTKSDNYFPVPGTRLFTGNAPSSGCSVTFSWHAGIAASSMGARLSCSPLSIGFGAVPIGATAYRTPTHVRCSVCPSFRDLPSVNSTGNRSIVSATLAGKGQSVKPGPDQ